MLLETARLRLRDYTLDDAEAAFSYYGDPEVMRFIRPDGPLETVDRVREALGRIIEKCQGQPLGIWALETLESGELIGGGLLNPMPDGSDVEVGYHLARKHWGRGYATEITKTLLDYGFSQLELERIVGVTFPDNAASQRVLLKAGLKSVGRSLYSGFEVERFEIVREEALATQP